MTHNEICVHGDLEALPVLCDLDYCTAKTHHAVLLRNRTLAEGRESTLQGNTIQRQFHTGNFSYRVELTMSPVTIKIEP